MNEEFKFEEDIGDTPKRSRASKKFSTIVAILVGLFFGITVFIIVSLLTHKEIQKEVPSTKVDINDEIVENLYEKFSYNQYGNLDPIFIKTKSLDLDSISNKDKYILALSLIKEDDLLDLNIVKSNKKVYYITPDVIRDNMKQFFGDEVKYTRDTTINNYIFGFEKDGMNTANIVYDTSSARFEVIFTKKTDIKEDIPTNRNYYSEITDAEIKENNLILTEKIVYVTCEEEEEKIEDVEQIQPQSYKCNLYKDYNKTIQIDKLENLDKNGIKTKSLKETNIIRYTFSKNNSGEYIFESSEIEN